MILCSTIIPTVNRPTLARAVNSVLQQQLDDDAWEVIVVNDSGSPLPEANWQKSPFVTVVNTNRCERSAARNVGAALAKGKFLHFLDDDDYILPGAYEALSQVAQSSACCWVYGGYRTVDDQEVLVSEIRPLVSGNLFALFVVGEAVPLGASWIRRGVFYQAGCFDSSLIVTEDRDLGRRIAFLGDICGTKEIVACFRVVHRTTTTGWSEADVADRLGREKALDLHGALARMQDSVRGNTPMRGRGCRAYVASAMVNLRTGNYLKVVSRLLFCARLAGLYAFTPGFWRGMRIRVRS